MLESQAKTCLRLDEPPDLRREMNCELLSCGKLIHCHHNSRPYQGVVLGWIKGYQRLHEACQSQDHLRFSQTNVSSLLWANVKCLINTPPPWLALHFLLLLAHSTSKVFRFTLSPSQDTSICQTRVKEGKKHRINLVN